MRYWTSHRTALRPYKQVMRYKPQRRIDRGKAPNLFTLPEQDVPIPNYHTFGYSENMSVANHYFLQLWYSMVQTTGHEVICPKNRSIIGSIFTLHKLLSASNMRVCPRSPRSCLMPPYQRVMYVSLSAYCKLVLRYQGNLGVSWS
jgi:hypothetical protein